jgi:ribonuclease P protein subunit POP4
MRVTPAIIKAEFIGLTAKIAESSNSSAVGIEGTVANETRNTFTIQCDGERKTVIKDQAVFHFTMPDGAVVEIDGKTLVGKPAERLKRRIRRLW